MLETLFFIVHAITLRNRQTVINIIEEHAVPRDVADETSTATPRQAQRLLRVCVWPDLNSRAFGRIGHVDVAHEDVLYVVDAGGILTKATYGDAVCAVAAEILNENVGAVGFEGDTVYSISSACRDFHVELILTVAVGDS